jgi:hypothetical protein
MYMHACLENLLMAGEHCSRRAGPGLSCLVQPQLEPCRYMRRSFIEPSVYM